MARRRFGDLISQARSAAGLSLRQLAERADVEYSRLSRIEHGTRPAPDLEAIRRLADVLDLDVVTLMVSAGTSREVVEEILWSERLSLGDATSSVVSYGPDESPIQGKNVFDVCVVERRRAVCTVAIGGARLRVLWFSPADRMQIRIPAQSVLVFRSDPVEVLGSGENVLRAEVIKLRRLGQIVNLVLQADGFKLNALQSDSHIKSAGLRESSEVYVHVPASAIRTGPSAP